MEIGTTLNLKDYRIIKQILLNREPEEFSEEIGLSIAEIRARKTKIKIFLNEYLNALL